MIQSRIPVPFLLENISYLFEWPESRMTDVAFLNLICTETGAGLLLDVENLYLNAHNHGSDPHVFLNDLPAGIVKECMSRAASPLRGFLAVLLAGFHCIRCPTALDLLDRVLVRHRPDRGARAR
jgi:hypothetical protein